MFSWINKLKTIVANYDMEMFTFNVRLNESNRLLNVRIQELEKVIKERTNISVDVNFKNTNHVIVTGRYKNIDYIQTFDVKSEDFCDLIDYMKSLERYGSVKRIDALPKMRAVFEREFKNRF